MGLIVQKFGGSSVKDRDRIFNVARIVMNTRNAGNDVVVVVSAQGDTTDDLIEKAAELLHNKTHSCLISSLYHAPAGAGASPYADCKSVHYRRFTVVPTSSQRSCTAFQCGYFASHRACAFSI